MSGPVFVLTGRVSPGKRLGQRLGFPTANIAYVRDGRAWPPDGVYIGTAEVAGDHDRYLAILNQGRHPTAPEGGPTVEAHLIGYSGHDLYGRQLTLCYRQFLRPEKKFEALHELAAQLEQDRRSAESWARSREPGLAGETRGAPPAQQQP